MSNTIGYMILLVISLICLSQSQIVIETGRHNVKQKQNNYAISDSLRFFGIGDIGESMCVFWQNGRCLFCREGYRLNEINDCQQVFNRCIITGNDGRCRRCMSYFELKNGICQDPRCIKDGIYDCSQCRLGYIKQQNGFCVDTFCVTYRNGYCITCWSDYELQFQRGMCIQKKNDTEYQTIVQTQTDTMKNKTQKITNQLIEPQNTNQTSQTSRNNFNNPFCEMYNIQGNCMKCYENYILFQQQCLPETMQCIQYNTQNGECIQCQPEYSLSNGNCQPKIPINCLIAQQNSCIQCYSGYFLDRSSRICLQIDANCKDYSRQTGLCYQCNSGFLLTDKKCYHINNSTQEIIFTPNNLPINNKTQEMLTLLSFYCIRWDENRSNCLQCYQSYYPISGVCQRISHLCLSFDNTTGYCNVCLRGYISLNGKCVPNSQQNPQVNCAQMYQNASACKTCQSGYFRYQRRICILADPSCNGFNLTTGRCNSCYKGFFLTDGYCRIIPIRIAVPFCNKYNPVDPRQCLSCIYGFYLTQNRCISLYQVCILFDRRTGICLQCAESYVVELGVCVRRISIQQLSPFCLQYNQLGLCTLCQPGYTLFNYICRNNSIL